jgi:hypothetical protein
MAERSNHEPNGKSMSERYGYEIAAVAEVLSRDDRADTGHNQGKRAEKFG